jgi:DNA primase
VEADSVAFIVATRFGLDTTGRTWPHVASWAGSDLRARPDAAIRATGDRITAAAASIIAHLDVALFGTPSVQALVVPVQQAQPGEPAPEYAADPGTHPAAAAPEPSPPPAHISRVLHDAELFYLSQAGGSWVPGYLAARGLGELTMTQWRIGYAPAGWTALLDHLRGQGHDDTSIEAAGLARRSSRGTLIDHFRDRVMLAIRTEDGAIAGFIGRAHPAAKPTVPKYLKPRTRSPSPKVTCCSASTRPTTHSPQAPSRSLSRARSTPSLSPPQTPPGTPDWHPAAPR